MNYMTSIFQLMYFLTNKMIYLNLDLKARNQLKNINKDIRIVFWKKQKKLRKEITYEFKIFMHIIFCFIYDILIWNKLAFIFYIIHI